MRAFFSFVAVLVLCCALGACGGGTDAAPATQAQIAALNAAATAPPVLQAGDKIHIVVYGEPTLSGDYPIDPSGFLAMPVVGSLKVAGMTPADLETKLVEDFRAAHILSPNVTVDIVEFRPFYILGEVDKPGAYQYIGGLNVMSALALAGGWTYRANQSAVLIQHAGEAEMHQYSLDRPIPILPGDIIEIPRRYI